MKKTTYILIGVLVLGALAIVAAMGFISMQGYEVNPYTVKVAGELKTVNLADAKKLVFEDQSDSTGRLDIGGSINIIQAKAGETPRIIYPSGWDKYMQVSESDSTIVIKLKYSAEKKKLARNYRSLISDKPITIILPAAVDKIDCECNLYFKLNGYSNQSLEINSVSGGSFENVFVKDLKLSGEGFEMKTGKAENLYVDIDRGPWTVVSGKFIVDTEYLSGSGENSNIVLAKGECKKVVYTPKSEDAVMKISVSQPVEITVTE